MTYDFTSLSHADFEDLSRDLIGKELGIRFEAFAADPDGGMDGRHAQGSKKTVLRKALCGIALQRSAACNEKGTYVDRPSRADIYILTTSCKLTSARKSELAQIIGPSLKLEADIFGPGDINSLLRRVRLESLITQRLAAEKVLCNVTSSDHFVAALAKA